MTGNVEEEAVSKIAPELRKARNDGLVVMVIVLILSLFIMDTGKSLILSGISAAAYWAILMFIIFLRGEKPILLDLLFARFGFLVLLLAALSITALIFGPA